MISSQWFKSTEWSDLLKHPSMPNNKWAQCTSYKANVSIEPEHSSLILKKRECNYSHYYVVCFAKIHINIRPSGVTSRLVTIMQKQYS